MLCQKRKPQINGLLLKSLLHILGQEKYCSWSLIATAIKGYHVLLVQEVHKKRKPHIDGLFLTILHILEQVKFSLQRTRLLHATADRGCHASKEKPGYYMVQWQVVTMYSRLFTRCYCCQRVTMYSYCKWYAKNRNHRLTAIFKVYCTY